jgi:3-hydroxyacyl-CoA dehydrogenase/3-hydroxy-2-methylbutyryl-CoA dehydrogenase
LPPAKIEDTTMKIEGSGFVVTGGASGLGLAAAKALRERGAQVGVLDVAECGGWDGAFAKADVSNEEQVAAALASLKAELGPVRGMLNAAGGGGAGLCLGDDATLTVAGFRRSLEINALGSFIMATHVGRLMLESEPDHNGERGVLINVSSIVALEGQMGTAGYACSKGGINAMTLPLAREFARFGIRVMTIAPGIFETPMFNAGGDALGVMNRGLREAVQFPARPGDPSEFGAAVAHIVENPMFNGHVLRLDGAYRVPPGDPSWWAFRNAPKA